MPPSKRTISPDDDRGPGAPRVDTDAVAPLSGQVRMDTTAEPRAEVRPRVIISEGAWQDLQRYGEVVDAATGLLVRLDHGVGQAGRVEVIDRRTGRPASADVVGLPRDVIAPGSPATGNAQQGG